MITNIDGNLLYVAGAYHSNTPAGIAKNILKAEKTSIALIRNNWDVFTPHKNTAGYEQYEDDTLNHNTWLSLDLNVLSRCDAVYVMDNWHVSWGTHEEILFAQQEGIPVYYEEECPVEQFTPTVVLKFWSLYENRGVQL